MAVILDSSGAPMTGKAREKLIKEQLKKSSKAREDDE